MKDQRSGSGVFGRDKLIRSIWKKLERNSLQFTAERRIGKTTVLKALLNYPLAGWEVRYLDLEKVESPKRFIEVLLNSCKDLMSGTRALISLPEVCSSGHGGSTKALI